MNDEEKRFLEEAMKNLFDNIINPIPQPEVHELTYEEKFKPFAELVWGTYQAFVNVGFNEDLAAEFTYCIVEKMLGESIERSKR